MAGQAGGCARVIVGQLALADVGRVQGPELGRVAGLAVGGSSEAGLALGTAGLAVGDARVVVVVQTGAVGGCSGGGHELPEQTAITGEARLRIGP